MSKIIIPRETPSDYPGHSCWEHSDSDMMNYTAQCRSTIPGTLGDVIMFNRDDIAGKLTKGTNDTAKWGIYYNLGTPPTGTTPGTWLNLLKNGSTGNSQITRDDYGVHWDHTVVIRFPQKSPQAKYFLTLCDQGQYSFILANRDGGVTGQDTSPTDASTQHTLMTFELYGYNAGLVLTNVSDTTDLTNGCVYELTFSNLEGEGYESGPPATIWQCNAASQTEAVIYAATKTAILAWVKTSTQELASKL